MDGQIFEQKIIPSLALPFWPVGWRRSTRSAAGIFDPATLTISGGRGGSDYGKIEINGGTGSRSPNVAQVPRSTQIALPKGAFELLFSMPDGCRDTLLVQVACPPDAPARLATDTVRIKTWIGETAFAPISTELPKPVFAGKRLVSGSSNGFFAAISFEKDALDIRAWGLAEGVEKAVAVVCDELGRCDSTWIEVEVGDRRAPSAAARRAARFAAGKSRRGDPARGTQKRLAFWPARAVRDRRAARAGLRFGDARRLGGGSGAGRFLLAGRASFVQIRDLQRRGLRHRRGCGLCFVRKSGRFHGFSPNDDGLNDFFKIEGLEKFAASELQIFDRWGQQVFEKANYASDWDGSWAGRSLPDGTYFWTLDLVEKDGSRQSLRGYLELQR